MIFLSVILKFIFPLSCSQFFNVFQNAFTLGQSTNKCLIDSIACSQKEHLLLSILLILYKNELVVKILLLIFYWKSFNLTSLISLRAVLY